MSCRAGRRSWSSKLEVVAQSTEEIDEVKSEGSCKVVRALDESPVSRMSGSTMADHAFAPMACSGRLHLAQLVDKQEVVMESWDLSCFEVQSQVSPRWESSDARSGPD